MPLKLIGKKWIGISSGKGSFYCPECRTQRDYIKKKYIQFFVLLNIPIVPLKFFGKHIECSKCKQTYWQSVLECSPEITRKELHPSILRMMVLMTIADGKIDNEEIETILKTYNDVTGKEISTDDINFEIKESKSEDISVEEYLKRITPYLNNYNKELIAKSAFLVSIADGEIREEEKILLYEICHALNMKREHFNEILSGIQDSETEVFFIPEEET